MLGASRWRLAPYLSAAGAFLAAIAIVWAGAAAPASAAGGLEFSRDGVHYSSTLSGPLFSQITVSVPGDHQSTRLYVRNGGTAAGFLRVALSNVTVSDPVLAHALTVTAGTTSFSGTPATLADARPCQVLTEGDLVPAGGTVEVNTDLALGDLTGLVGQGGTATFSFTVLVSDSAAGSLPPTVCGGGSVVPLSGGGGEIPLAYTGAEIPLPLIIGAASVLGVGLFFVVAARRRKERDE